MNIRSGSRAIALALLSVLGVRVAPARPPNILVCVSDDQSFPHASAYGTRWVRTPAFDRIAREGVLFTRAFTPNAKCAPSRACLLTGVVGRLVAVCRKHEESGVVAEWHRAVGDDEIISPRNRVGLGARHLRKVQPVDRGHQVEARVLAHCRHQRVFRELVRPSERLRRAIHAIVRGRRRLVPREEGLAVAKLRAQRGDL